ncbi:MAG: zinc-dependent peptidase [Planctomycetaceae bacterium]|nr:zinc-dependent peptidase [Planctomycetaceae bacterium]
MLFRWLRNRRRRRILAEPFPHAWRDWLEDEVVHYARLDPERQAQLRDLLQVFVTEKNWEGLQGLQLTDAMKVTIAALACLLILGRPQELDFDHVLSILIYPDVFLARQQQPNAVGVVSERREARIGEAWYRGPVILSWEDVWEDARQDYPGGNVVLHEFEHQLDMSNGQLVDGTPPMRDRAEYERWVAVMEREFHTLIDRCRRCRPGVLDCYGSQNPAEFFAVATEAFFERPTALHNHLPDLFAILHNFYALDPAEWTRDPWGAGDRDANASAT